MKNYNIKIINIKLKLNNQKVLILIKYIHIIEKNNQKKK